MNNINNSNDYLQQRVDTLLENDYRNPYSRDKSRIVHSASFRRLQGKTQVFGSNESDFYRNRLTHSLEVAQISNGILEYITWQIKYGNQQQFKCYLEDFPQNSYILDAISLAHDLGHPPFGHTGEVALNYSMLKHSNYTQGFESNAQNLRICMRLGEYSPTNGFNLTRRVLLGLLKYPINYTHAINANLYKIENERDNTNIKKYNPPKFCAYEEECSWILEPFPEQDIAKFTSTIKSIDNKTHHKSIYKSLDCSIMELADDIAYGIHDLEDCIQLGIVNKSTWQEQVLQEYINNPQKYGNKEDLQLIFSLSDKLFYDQKGRKYAIGQLVNYFITNIYVIKQDVFITNILDLQVTLPLHIQQQLAYIKHFIVNCQINNMVFNSLNYKWQQMIIKLFNTIVENPKELLPNSDYKKYCINEDSRIICDYIAGMTNIYLNKIYQRIFLPNNGSIFDKI